MTTSTTFATFHQWLLTDPAVAGGARTIVLHLDESLEGGGLIEGIADYLNEYDDDGDGLWLAATSELVERVSSDSNYLQLLGIDEPVENNSECRLATLIALGQRGHVIVTAPSAGFKGLGGMRCFHAGVGRISSAFAECHLILNSDLLEPTSIAPTIGDVFLEWLHCRFPQGTALHQME